MKPRSQTTPPKCDGVWVRVRRSRFTTASAQPPERRAFHFYWDTFGTSEYLACGLPGMVHSPTTLHEEGDTWEGPFPVPRMNP